MRSRIGDLVKVYKTDGLQRFRRNHEQNHLLEQHYEALRGIIGKIFLQEHSLLGRGMRGRQDEG